MSFINFPTPTPVFPTLSILGWPRHKKPSFTQWEHLSVNGKQWQTARQVYPNWEYDFAYDWARDQTQNQVPWRQNVPYVELQSLSQLFLSCRGPYGEFYYDDPDDDSRFSQPIGIGDGSTTAFLIVRTWGIGALARTEPVGGVSLGEPIDVYLNGVLQSGSNYAVTNDSNGSHLTFNTGPGAGVAITMDFYFYYRCRWLDDGQTFEQWAYNLWTYGKCRFRSVKP